MSYELQFFSSDSVVGLGRTPKEEMPATNATEAMKAMIASMKATPQAHAAANCIYMKLSNQFCVFESSYVYASVL